MDAQKFSVKNRHGLKLVIQVDSPDNPESLVFIEPGQGGTIDQVHITAFADAFLANGYRTIRFDPTHSVGESEGDIFDVTYDNYVEDLEDVISWARTQKWFKQPFALCGHSMGAQAVTWYAEHNPSGVMLLAPMAPVVNYELLTKTMDEDFKNRWQNRGHIEIPSRSKPGIVKKIGWGVNESLKKFDIVLKAGDLKMPVINIVGEKDHPCQVEHQQIFMDTVGSKNKRLVTIPGAEHSYRNVKSNDYGKEIEEAKKALSIWLRRINT